MTFSDLDKLKALAIVHVFETSKPFGDYAACAVLDDGAGVSYGINQFTHGSGSLAAVVTRCISKDRKTGRQFPILEDYLPQLRNTQPHVVAAVAKSEELKRALRLAGRTPEMQEAQREIGFELYLKPAIDACKGSHFELPLSLAVIYDSINHGSYAKIRDRVKIDPSSVGFEKAWIKQYVRNRDAWLESYPRLAKTDYRTDFFLYQIGRGNWDLDLPLEVQGLRLTDATFKQYSAVEQPAVIQPEPAQTIPSSSSASAKNDAQPPAEEEGRSAWETTAEIATTAAGYIDQAETVVNGISRRRQSVRSTWKAIWGMALALFGFVVGLPWQVWLVIGLAAAGTAIYFAYRRSHRTAK